LHFGKVSHGDNIQLVIMLVKQNIKNFTASEPFRRAGGLSPIERNDHAIIWTGLGLLALPSFNAIETPQGQGKPSPYRRR
jgi:hypothetical protein